MVPIEFKALLAGQPMRRTAKGIRLACGMTSDLPHRQLALLRRFTGETLLEYLVGASEPMEEVYADAYALFVRQLIVPSQEPRPTSWH
jgi:hypothetical protein